MSAEGKQRLLERLREGPHTLGWDAILAFSRRDLDRFLEQSHIERYGRALHLRPFKGFVGDSNIAGQYFDGCTLSNARLSFAGADVQAPEPGVRLTMQVSSGRQLTLERIQGHLQATRLWLFDPLHGPQLSLEVPLSTIAADADADSAGQVVIDLHKGSAFKFSFTGLAQERFVDSEPFERLFKCLSDAQSILPLVKINKAGDQAIKPARFSIRTQPSPHAATQAGDGALLLLVAMHDQPDGEAPDAGFAWLLADDAGTQPGSTVVLSNKLLLDTLVGAQWLASTNGLARWQVTTQPSGFIRLQPSAGYFRLAPVFYHDPVKTMWPPPDGVSGWAGRVQCRGD